LINDHTGNTAVLNADKDLRRNIGKVSRFAGGWAAPELLMASA
jgi:hypothetical protein